MSDQQKKIQREVLDAIINKGDLRPLIKNYGNFIRYAIRKKFMKSFIAFAEMDIEDIEQEVYIFISKNDFRIIKELFDPDKSSLRFFLNLIAEQKAFAEIRKIKDALYPSHRKIVDSIDDESKQIVFDEIYLEDSRFEAREKIAFLDSAVNDLDAYNRIIFELKYYDNVDMKFIVQLVNKSKKAIESLLFRIKDELKKQMDKKFNE